MARKPDEAGDKPDARPDIPPAFDTLMRAKSVAFGGVGFANLTPPTAVAFDQISATGSVHMRHIERLLTYGSPAGRVYAATLLSGIDPARAARIWGGLCAQPGMFDFLSGCVVERVELSQYAARQLRQLGVDYRNGQSVRRSGADQPAGAAPAAADEPTATEPGVDDPDATAALIVDARSLQSILASGPLDPARAVRIVGHVATMLDGLHAKGMVHRQVMPRTILVNQSDDVRLTGGWDESSLPDTGEIAPAVHIEMMPYMAPEFLLERRSAPQSDIYSLTCVLYECLTGGTPFAAPSIEEALSNIIVKPPPTPSAAGVHISPDFDAVIAKGLAKRPDERYATASELARHTQDAAGLPGVPPFFPGTWYPEVDTDVARQAIADALSSQRGIVLVSARDDRHFVDGLFPGSSAGPEVYVSRQVRAGSDRGPHFDLYDGLLHEDFPFVATFNLAGKATVDSAILDPALTSYYLKHYPQPTESAYVARRMVSELTLLQAGTRVDRGRIEPGVGMIIPQRKESRPVVHEVVPAAPFGPQLHGVFLKFIVPRPDRNSLAIVAEQGFAPWRPGIDWSEKFDANRPIGPAPFD